MPRVKREPKYTLIEFVEAANAMLNWVGNELAPGCINNRWLASMALPSEDSCSNSKFSHIQLKEDNMG